MSSELVEVEIVTEEAIAFEEIGRIRSAGGIVREQKVWTVPPELIDDYGDAQFEPMIIIAAALSIGFIVRRITETIEDLKRPGGQVIDTTHGRLEIRSAPHLDRGTLVLITDKGPVVYSAPRTDEAVTAITSILGAAE
jgi:hypothetical protein